MGKRITVKVTANLFARIIFMVIGYVLATKYQKDISEISFLNEEIIEEFLVYVFTIVAALIPEIILGIKKLKKKFSKKGNDNHNVNI